MSESHTVRDLAMGAGFATLAAVTISHAGDAQSAMRSEAHVDSVDPSVLSESNQLQISPDLSIILPTIERVSLSTYPVIEREVSQTATQERPQQAPQTSTEAPPPTSSGEPREIEFRTEVPPEVSEFMAEETIRFDTIGCSGLTINNSAGKAIGASLAGHCEHDEIIKGTDGKSYIYRTQPIKAQTGNINNGSLKNIGTASIIAVHEGTDKEQDAALIAFEGHKMQEVTAANSSLLLSKREVLDLVPGKDVVYLSHWASLQPNNHGKPRRQENVLMVLGVAPHFDNPRNNRQLLWAAGEDNKDGSNCTPRASGANGLVEITKTNPDGSKTKQMRSVGPLSRFADLRPESYSSPEAAARARAVVQSYFKIKIPLNIDKICGFYLDGLNESNQLDYKIVDDPNLIPGYYEAHDNTPFIMRATRDFLDDKVPKTIIHGFVPLSGQFDPDKDTFIGLQDPTAFYDEAYDKVVLIGYSANDRKNHLYLLPFNGLGSISFKDTDGKAGMETAETNGAITADSQAQEFVDAKGTKFGQSKTMTSLSLAGKALYNLSLDRNHHLVPQPLEADDN